jgi:hypothetical protein
MIIESNPRSSHRRPVPRDLDDALQGIRWDGIGGEVANMLGAPDQSIDHSSLRAATGAFD